MKSRALSLALIVVLCSVSLIGQQRLFRIVGLPASSDVLQATDLTYLGMFKLPNDNCYSFNYGGLTGRYVSGVHHLIMYCGNSIGTVPGEVVDPGSYSPVLASAPRATKYGEWDNALTCCVNGNNLVSWYLDNLHGGTRGDLIPGLNHFASGIHWDEANNQLMFSLWAGYNSGDLPLWTIGVASAPGAPSGGVISSTSCGPFKTSLGSPRSFYFKAYGPDPTKLFAGGSVESAGVTAAPWGPAGWTGFVAPTCSTPAGWPTAPAGNPEADIWPSTEVFMNSHYMGEDNGDATSQYTHDGQLTGVNRALRRPSFTGNPLGDYVWHADNPNEHLDPLKNSGNGAFTFSDRFHDAVWIQGVHKSGVLFVGGAVQGDGITAPTVGAINANGGTATYTLTNLLNETGLVISGTWTGTLITECFNGSWVACDMTHGRDCEVCAPPVSFASTAVNDIVRVNPSGFTQLRVRATAWSSGIATITWNDCIAHVQYASGADYCNHGCHWLALATGPSFTSAIPQLAILDPAQAEQVRTGAIADYVPVPTLINLRTEYGLITSSVAENGFNSGILGSYYDTTGKKLYMMAPNADAVTIPGFSQPLIHVFDVDDSAPPAPLVPLVNLLAVAGLAIVARRRAN